MTDIVAYPVVDGNSDITIWSASEAPSISGETGGGVYMPWRRRRRSIRQEMATDNMLAARQQALVRKAEQREQRMEALARANIVNESRRKQ